MDIHIVQDADRAIRIMHGVGVWMERSGLSPSKWWQPKNLSNDFLFRWAKPTEFYAVLIDGSNAGAFVMQNLGDYMEIHWICVTRKYAGRGIPKIIVEFVNKEAIKSDIHSVRVDTNADETKLTSVYEKLGFRLLDTKQENYRRTAFYELKV